MIARFRQFAADLARAFRRLFTASAVEVTAPCPPKTIILAYNYDMAREYARDNHLGPADWLYPRDAHDLQGFHNVRIVRLAGWKDRRDREFIQGLLRLESHIGRWT